jgi:hypothetical protein
LSRTSPRALGMITGIGWSAARSSCRTVRPSFTGGPKSSTSRLVDRLPARQGVLHLDLKSSNVIARGRSGEDPRPSAGARAGVDARRHRHVVLYGTRASARRRGRVRRRADAWASRAPLRGGHGRRPVRDEDVELPSLERPVHPGHPRPAPARRAGDGDRRRPARRALRAAIARLGVCASKRAKRVASSLSLRRKPATRPPQTCSVALLSWWAATSEARAAAPCSEAHPASCRGIATSKPRRCAPGGRRVPAAAIEQLVMPPASRCVVQDGDPTA